MNRVQTESTKRQISDCYPEQINRKLALIAVDSAGEEWHMVWPDQIAQTDAPETAHTIQRRGWIEPGSAWTRR